MSSGFAEVWAYILALVGHTVTLLAGCGATVMLGLIQKYGLKKPLSVKWEIAILGVFVFFAGFQAWQNEHEKVETITAQLQKTTAPQLSGKIITIMTGGVRGHEQDTIITIDAYVTNTGAPSIAKDFALSVYLPNGKTVTGQFMMPPAKGSSYVMTFDSGQKAQVYEDAFLLRKAMDQPIPSNGAVGGILMALVHGVTLKEIRSPGILIEITFTDINGKLYSVKDSNLSWVGSLGNDVISKPTKAR